jgi:uncharacterized protein YbjT (DUF2867 family)
MGKRILVTGATGRTGTLVVDRVLAHSAQYTVRVVLRRAEQAAAFAQRGVEIALANVQDDTPGWADTVMQGVDVVISTMGGTPFQRNNLWRVDYAGTCRLLAAAQGAGVDQYIFVSTMGLRRKRSIVHPFSILFYPKLLAEDAIRNSGLRYTILRPGGLVDGPPSRGTRNTRAEVAEACVTAVGCANMMNKTVEMSAGRRAQPGADPMFGVAITI